MTKRKINLPHGPFDFSPSKTSCPVKDFRRTYLDDNQAEVSKNLDGWTDRKKSKKDKETKCVSKNNIERLPQVKKCRMGPKEIQERQGKKRLSRTISNDD